MLLGWLPGLQSSSARLPGRAEQAARWPPAVCGFGDVLTLLLPKASLSLDSFLIHMMDEKTEGDAAGRGVEGELEYLHFIISAVF